MSNFNKFLENKEGLIFWFRSVGRGYGVYATLFFIVLIFFLLYPMWQYGRQGLGLWAIALIISFIILAKQLLVKDKIYLFTTKRLLMLEPINQKSLKAKGSISHKKIRKVLSHGKDNIILTTASKNYTLVNIENRDKVVSKIKAYLQL